MTMHWPILLRHGLALRPTATLRQTTGRRAAISRRAASASGRVPTPPSPWWALMLLADQNLLGRMFSPSILFRPFFLCRMKCSLWNVGSGSLHLTALIICYVYLLYYICHMYISVAGPPTAAWGCIRRYARRGADEPDGGPLRAALPRDVPLQHAGPLHEPPQLRRDGRQRHRLQPGPTEGPLPLTGVHSEGIPHPS